MPLTRNYTGYEILSAVNLEIFMQLNSCKTQTAYDLKRVFTTTSFIHDTVSYVGPWYVFNKCDLMIDSIHTP